MNRTLFSLSLVSCGVLLTSCGDTSKNSTDSNENQNSTQPQELYGVYRKEKLGFVDRTGKTIIEPQFDKGDYLFSEGFATVMKKDANGVANWSFIDTSGRPLTEFKYRYAQKFSEGIAKVSDRKTSKWGLIDKKGNEIAPQWISVLPFKSEKTWANAGTYDEPKWMLIDKTGATLSDKTWDSVLITDGDVTSVKKEDKWGFVDTNGNIIIEPTWDEVSFGKEGLIPVKKNEKWGFVDYTGKVTIEPKYTMAVGFHEGVCRIYDEEDKIGLIDKTGKWILPMSLDFDKIENFSENLAAVSKNGKWGYIDKAGEMVLDAVWDEAKKFNDGLAFVAKGEKFGMIDTTGKVVIPLEFDTYYFYQNGLARMKKDGYKVMVDQTGKTLFKISDKHFK